MRDPLQQVHVWVKGLMLGVYHYPQFGLTLGFEENSFGDAITAAFCCPTDPFRPDVGADIVAFRLKDGFGVPTRPKTRVQYCKKEVVKALLYSLGFCRSREEARVLLFDATGLGCAQDFPQVFSTASRKEVAKAEKRFAIEAPKVIS